MRILILSLVLIGLLSACNTSHRLTNLENHDITYLLDSDETLADIETSIIRGGKLLGWEMKKVKTGLIQGTLNLRAHTAVVDIPYSLKSYSVLYVSSKNLDYDGQMIHRSYPRWVNNLRAKIDEQISMR